MRALCPTDPAHQTFLTAVRIDELWRVSERGDLYGPADGGRAPLGGPSREHVDGPSPHRTWTCEACGATAILTKGTT